MNEAMAELVGGLLEKEDRKDVEFRYAILATEIGDLGKYITHDQVLNPNARPHGSKADEVQAFGQVFIQLIALAHLRGIDYLAALDQGVRNWIDADWRKKAAVEGLKVRGVAAAPGMVSAEAYVLSKDAPLSALKGSSEKKIVVMPHAKADFAAVMDAVAGIVTDHGGYTCHAANICRDRGIPCIVGTGNATKNIVHGGLVRLIAGTREQPRLGEVYF